MSLSCPTHARRPRCALNVRLAPGARQGASARVDAVELASRLNARLCPGAALAPLMALRSKLDSRDIGEHREVSAAAPRREASRCSPLMR